MTVLLAGKTNYLTSDNLLSSFPEEDFIVLGKVAENTSKRVKEVTHWSSQDVNRILEVYSVQGVIYFSDFLNAASHGHGELEQFATLMEAVKNRKELKIIHVTGPDLQFSISSQRSIVMQSIEELYEYFQKHSFFNMKTIYSPHFYSLENKEDSIGNWLSEDTLPTYQVHPQQLANYIQPNEILSLCYRVLDNWNTEKNDIIIKTPFSISYQEIVEQLGVEERAVFNADLPLFSLSVDSDEDYLMKQYGWFVKYHFWNDFHVNKQTEPKQKTEILPLWRKITGLLREQGVLVRLVEIFVLFLVIELLSRNFSQNVYLKSVDFRLFFIILMSFIFGTGYGLLAAALTTFGAIMQAVEAGSNFTTIFYDAANWTPYIIYFVSSILFGSIRDNDQQHIQNLKEKQSTIHRKLENEQQFVNDLIEQKVELSRQILVRQDSYGKIWDFVHQLDTPYLDYFFIQLVENVSSIFETDAVSIYASDNGRLGKVLLSKTSDYIPPQFDSKNVLFDIDEKGFWMNHHLKGDAPIYMGALEYDGEHQFYLAIHEVELEKLNLYYQNLFEVLLHLSQHSFKNLKIYVEAKSEQYLAQDQRGNVILNDMAFFDRLMSFKEMKRGNYFLLELDVPSTMSYQKLLQQLSPYLTPFDALGVEQERVYLMTSTLSAKTAEDWQSLLRDVGVHVKPMVRNVDEMIETIQMNHLVL